MNTQDEVEPEDLEVLRELWEQHLLDQTEQTMKTSDDIGSIKGDGGQVVLKLVDDRYWIVKYKKLSVSQSGSIPFTEYEPARKEFESICNGVFY